MVRLRTERVGVSEVEDVGFDVRVVSAVGEDGTREFRSVVGGALGETRFSSLEEAAGAIEGRAVWRAGCEPEAGEGACFVCGVTTGPRSERHPELLCPACKNEAVDENGAALRFGNQAMSGGFTATVSASGAARDSHACWVRGIACWADEAYFGGIVIVPLSRRASR